MIKKKKKHGLQKNLHSKCAFSKKYDKEMDYQTDPKIALGIGNLVVLALHARQWHQSVFLSLSGAKVRSLLTIS